MGKNPAPKLVLIIVLVVGGIFLLFAGVVSTIYIARKVWILTTDMTGGTSLVYTIDTRGLSEEEKKDLQAEDFRLTIDPSGRKLQSTIYQIVSMGDKWEFFSGRGYGHGVGMCQCGAQAMARKGKTAEQILSYYYRGSRIKTVY